MTLCLPATPKLREILEFLSIEQAHAFGGLGSTAKKGFIWRNISIWHKSIQNYPGCIEITCEPRHEISNNVVCATSKDSDQPAHMRSLIRAYASRLNIL